MADYSKMTDEEFDEILCEIVNEDTPTNIVTSIPGVYEIVSEHFNNDVLTRWVKRNPTKAYEHTVKCPRCGVLIGLEDINDDTIKCDDCGQEFRVLHADGKMEATEMLPYDNQ